ncbi:MAG: hypothetical protein ACYDHO_01560 [Gaiellaceae bacterium]
MKPLSETEAYAHCYGGRGDEVRIVKVEPRRARYETGVSGERLREAFESRLDTREPSEEIEPGDEAGPSDPIELSDALAPGEELRGERERIEEAGPIEALELSEEIEAAPGES